MANNKSILLLRLRTNTVDYRDTGLLEGQPMYSEIDELLYIGKKNGSGVDVVSVGAVGLRHGTNPGSIQQLGYKQKGSSSSLYDESTASADYAVALQVENTAAGTLAFVTGKKNNVGANVSNSAILSGESNTIAKTLTAGSSILPKYTAILGGNSNSAYNTRSSLIGGDSNSIGTATTPNQINNSFLFGNNLTTGYSNQFVVGKFNSDVSGALFVVGVGTSDSDRKNGLVVTTSGASLYGTLKVTGSATLKNGCSITGNCSVTSNIAAKTGSITDSPSWDATTSIVRINELKDFRLHSYKSFNMNSSSFGGGCTVTGSYSGAAGLSNTVEHSHSFAFGKGLTSTNNCSIIVGQYNDSSITNAYFAVGGGGSTSSTSTPFYVSTTGTTNMNNGIVNGTTGTVFKVNNTAFGVTGAGEVGISTTPSTTDYLKINNVFRVTKTGQVYRKKSDKSEEELAAVSDFDVSGNSIKWFDEKKGEFLRLNYSTAQSSANTGTITFQGSTASTAIQLTPSNGSMTLTGDVSCDDVTAAGNAHVKKNVKCDQRVTTKYLTVNGYSITFS